MRHALILAGLLLVTPPDCGNANNTHSANSPPPPAAVSTPPRDAASPAAAAAEPTDMPDQRRIHDLEFKADVRAVEGGGVSVTYSVRNTGGTTYLLFNRGDTETGLERGQFYVEPLAEGVVEISQKHFAEPKDRNCPERESPIRHGVTVLAPGQRVAEELSVTPPLKHKTPYNDCTPLPAMPEPVRRIRFCLGVIEADAGKTVVAERQVRIVKDPSLLARQQLLCSNAVELQRR